MDARALAQALRALGDATRLRMAQDIAAAGELSCGQVAERFDLSQPTISHHLRKLVDAGVLTVREAGQHRFISINQRVIRELALLLPARLTPRRRRVPGRARSTVMKREGAR
jgi:ArsR family transcriptional regulator, arsenate/arsenite/antimonite-responsive transcriptional repressor